jgi:hypothetical protein
MHRRTYPKALEKGLGLLLLGLVALALVVAVQLVRLKPWARPAALALEVVAVVLALTRIAAATGPALVSLVLSAAVITLLLSAGSFDRDYGSVASVLS